MMQNKYEIYWRKEQNGTPNQPISPTNQATMSPRNNTSTLRKSAMIGIGALAARRVFSTVRQEIRASGNERLQNNIDNAMKAVGYATAIAINPIVGTAYIALDTALGAVSYNRQLQRDNVEARFDRELNGKRVNIARGSVYYD